MNVAFFSTKNWVKDAFDKHRNQFGFSIKYLEPKLSIETVSLAQGYDAICVFVNDILDAPVIDKLAEYNVKTIALRCAGFNNVDVKHTHEKGIIVVRVPAYSPYAVAEHALGLILALNRKFYKAYNRVRDGNFSLDGLLGFDLYDKTVGIIGTGKIGRIFADILAGFHVNVLAYDKFPNSTLAEKEYVRYVELQELYSKSDIISLHCPLTHETYHIINEYAIKTMKKGVMIINTSRGPLIDTNAVIAGLKNEQISYLGSKSWRFSSRIELATTDLQSGKLFTDRIIGIISSGNYLKSYQTMAEETGFTRRRCIEAVKQNEADQKFIKVHNFILTKSSKYLSDINAERRDLLSYHNIHTPQPVKYGGKWHLCLYAPNSYVTVSFNAELTKQTQEELSHLPLVSGDLTPYIHNQRCYYAIVPLKSNLYRRYSNTCFLTFNEKNFSYQEYINNYSHTVGEVRTAA
jgi:D-lactate dehydrogenase